MRMLHKEHKFIVIVWIILCEDNGNNSEHEKENSRGKGITQPKRLIL